MANVSWFLDCRRLKNGRGELKFAFRNANTTAFQSSGIFIEPAYWNGSEVVKVKDRVRRNTQLISMLARMVECVDKVAGLRSKQKATVIRDRAVSLYDGDKSEVETLFTLWDRHVNKQPRPAKTVESFAITRKKIQQFTNNESLLVDDITDEWLWKFETWMQGKELSTNTRAIQMENLRAVVNFSNSLGLSSNLVFKRWRIKREDSKKRALPFETLCEIWNYTADTPYEQLCIDIFKLQVCLCGINMIDLFSLTENNIVDGRLEYDRTKTGVHVSIKLEPEALELIALHKGHNGHLVCLADHCKDHKTFLDRYNRRLKLIGPTTYEGHNIVAREPKWPYLSSYYSRHTPATLLARMGCPVHVIGMGVGHAVDRRDTTFIYIDPYRPQLDFFMRKMLDAITSGEMPKNNALTQGLLEALINIIS